MRAPVVVVQPPRLDSAPGIGEADEPMAIETFVAQPSLKTLDEGVLDGLTRLDEVQPYPSFIRPPIDGFACQLRSVVQHNLVRHAALSGYPLQDAHHPPSWERGVDLDGQRLAGEDIHDRKESDPPTPGQSVTHEVDAPLLVGSFWQRHPPPTVAGHAFAPPASYGETFLAIEPFDPLVVDPPALASQQDVQPSIAEPRALFRQRPQSLAQ